MLIVMSSLYYSGGTGGWTYHNSFCSILQWLAMAFLPIRLQKISFFQYAPSFLFFSLGLHANPQALPTIPAFALLSVIPLFDKIDGNFATGIFHRHKIKNIFYIILYAINAFSIATLTLAIIHKLLYGTYYFFETALEALLYTIQKPSFLVAGAKPHHEWGWEWLSQTHIVFLIG